MSETQERWYTDQKHWTAGVAATRSMIVQPNGSDSPDDPAMTAHERLINARREQVIRVNAQLLAACRAAFRDMTCPQQYRMLNTVDVLRAAIRAAEEVTE